MTVRSTLSSKSFQTFFGIALAVFLLWLFFRGTDFQALQGHVREARLGYLALATAIVFGSHFLRAIRWRVLLAPLGRASLWNCFSTTIIGFMVNFLLPSGRLGEIARPYLLARKEGFSASSAFATVFLERVFDLITVILLIGFWLSFATLPATSEEVVRGLEVGGAVGFAGALGALGVLFLFARYPDGGKRLCGQVLSILPDRLERPLVAFAETFIAGLGVLVDPVRFLKAVVMSICVWSSIAASFYLGARALGVEFPYGDTFLIIGFLTIGVAAPTPGAVGGYHYMGALALTTLYSVEPSVAKAVALVNHALAYLPVALAGIVLFPQAGASIRQLKSLSTETKEHPE